MGVVPIQYEKVSSGKTQIVSLCLHTMYNVCNSHYEKKGHHPRFGLHCHRSTCLTFMYVFFSHLFTFEDVKIKKSPPSGIDATQYRKMFVLIQGNGMHLPCSLRCKHNGTLILSGLCVVSHPCSIFGREDIGVASTPTQDCHKKS